MFKKNKHNPKPNTNQMSIIGKNIRQLRQQNGWSQGEVAKRLMISVPAFSKIETGITDVNISRLDQIAKLFEISTLDILSLGNLKSADINSDEVCDMRTKIIIQEEEILKLQRKVIELYEEIRKDN